MKPWVLVSLLSEAQEYQRLQATEARAAAERGGLDVRVLFSDNEPAKQVQQISDAISAPEGSRPVAVVAETSSSAGFERVARSTLEAGVGWVLVSDNARYLDALRREFPGKLVAAACLDNEEMGRTLAKISLRLLPAGGALLSVEGPTATAATLQRRRALEEGIRGTMLRIGKTLGADWTAAGAQKAAVTWLKLAGKTALKPDLIVSLNDEMAVGAVNAIRAQRPDWGAIRAIGVDGLPEGGQKLVADGLLTATLVTPASAGPGVELVVTSVRGLPVPPLESIQVRPYPPIEELRPTR